MSFAPPNAGAADLIGRHKPPRAYPYARDSSTVGVPDEGAADLTVGIGIEFAGITQGQFNAVNESNPEPTGLIFH